MKEKIALAFSGGVDSSIAAIKLAKAGFDVHAIYLKFWKWKDNETYLQNLKKTVQDIESQVKITFSLIDAAEIMRETVVDDFINQLKIGMTPSPCIRCNPLIKFRLLLHYADEHSIEKIATGHYARVIQAKDGESLLYRAKDKSKDQSYMLCLLTQSILSRTVFPLGEFTKNEIVAYAKELELIVSEQPESQDLCFLNQYSYNDFIEHFSPDILIPGKIVDQSGKELGQHNGLPLYTIGQRKGIRIASSAPYYVIEKDIAGNRLIVGHLSELGRDKMRVDQVNWISGVEILNIECDVKIRYRSKLFKGIVEKCNDGSYSVQFSEKLRDITPGQYAVFYKGDNVLGGGMIMEAL